NWAGDGKSIYCASTAEGRDLIGLARIDLASGKLSYVDTPKHEVESVHVSPKGRWLAWLTNDGGASHLHLGDLRREEKLEFKNRLGVITEMSFVADDSRLALVFDGPRQNMDIHVLETRGEASSVRHLTHSSRAGIPFSQFVEPELVHYETFDKLKIP